MSIYFKNYPKTEEGKKLQLDDDLAKELLVVYRRISENGNWEFHGLKNDDEIYLEDDIFMPVESTYGGYIRVLAGTNFTNVIGSKDDRMTGVSSWIRLMEKVYFDNKLPMNLLNSCCTDGNYYDSNSQGIIKSECKGCLVGGHVLLNSKVNDNPRMGAIVYLLPICSSHNVSRLCGGKAGTYYFMKAKCDIYAIQLNKYLMKEQVECYMNNYTTME